jgi:hypothetical protein
MLGMKQNAAFNRLGMKQNYANHKLGNKTFPLNSIPINTNSNPTMNIHNNQHMPINEPVGIVEPKQHKTNSQSLVKQSKRTSKQKKNNYI